MDKQAATCATTFDPLFAFLITEPVGCFIGLMPGMLAECFVSIDYVHLMSVHCIDRSEYIRGAQIGGIPIYITGGESSRDSRIWTIYYRRR